MVRIEHAFDNSQIHSEFYTVSQLIKHGHAVGIDTKHHIVVPICVQMNSIEKIPQYERTIFHHISYSIQPVVFNTITIDLWYRRNHPNNASTLKLCAQMAKALVHLHACNIVHGDIKPGNTLILTRDPANITSSDSDSDSDNVSDTASDPADSSNTDSKYSMNHAMDHITLYVIDYGMSNAHGLGEGTGGTKPYCAPETGNGYKKNTKYLDSYNWTKNKKEHDIWSFGLMFFTMLALNKCICHEKEYPDDFFYEGGHVNASYFDRIKHESVRDLFQRALGPIETRCTAVEFMNDVDAVLNYLCD